MIRSLLWSARKVALLVVVIAVVMATLTTVEGAPASASIRRSTPLASAPRTPRHAVVQGGDFSNPPPRFPDATKKSYAAKGGLLAGAKLSSRTATSNVYLNPDGSHTAQIAAGPINYQTSTGDWQPISTKAVTNPDGRIATQATASQISVAPTAASGTLAQLSNGTWSVGFNLAGATNAVGVAKGSVVTYANVQPGIDLQEILGTSGVKEQLILRQSTTASATFSFPLTLTGVTAQQESDGSIGFLDPTGKEVAVLPVGSAIDAHADISLGQMPVISPVSVTLVGAPGAQSVQVSVPTGWLNDPARLYPIYIDPSLLVYGSSTTYDAFAEQATPTTNYNGSAQWNGSYYIDYAGYLFGTQDYTYQHFDTSAIPTNSVVSSAQWGDFVQYAQTDGETFDLWKGSAAWTDSSVTWNTLPGHTPDNILLTATNGATSYAEMGSWAQSWVNNPSTNYGIAIDTAGHSSVFVSLMAVEENAIMGGFSPQLTVTYDTPPNASTLTYPAAAGTIMTGTPTMTASTATDPDGQAVSYWFRVVTGQSCTTGQIIDSGWLPSPSWTVPTGSLMDGTTYSWCVITSDGSLTTYSATGTFKVNLRLGVTPTSPTDSVGPATVNLATGNAAYQTSTPALNTVGGKLQSTFSYNSQAQPAYGLTGSYFSNCTPMPNPAIPSGTPQVVRQDPVINFAWTTGSSPSPSIGSTGYCAQWKGYVTFPHLGSWALGAEDDDGIQIFIDGNLVLDRSNSAPVQVPNQMAGAVAFDTNGQFTHQITINYYNNTGPGYVNIWAQGPVPVQPIPASWLSPVPQTLPQGWSFSSDDGQTLSYSSARVGPNDVVLNSPDGSTSEYINTGGGGAAANWKPTVDGDATLTTDGSNYTVQGEDGVTYVFNGLGQLTSAISGQDDVKPAAPIFNWSATNSRLASIQDPVSGRQLTFSYATDPTDPSAACRTMPSGFTYPPVGSLCQVTYPDGTQSNLYYNANGQFARLDNWAGGSAGAEETDFAYASSGQLASVRSSLANDEINAGLRSNDATVLTSIAYDSSGRVASVTQPAPQTAQAQPQQSYIYGTTGLGLPQTLVQTTGFVGTFFNVTRSVVSDLAGRTLTDTDAAGHTTSYTWDNFDGQTSKIDPTGLESTTIYDNGGDGAVWGATPPHLVTAEYGPGPSSCFSGLVPNGTCTAAQTPLTTTNYDEGLNSLAAVYYTNTTANGTPHVHGTGTGDPNGAIFPNWNGNPPVSGMPSGSNWSAEFTGSILLPQTGTYSFQATVDDGARIYVDDTLVSDGWTGYTGTNTPVTATINNTVTNSYHRIRVSYWQASGPSYLTLDWTPPGTGLSLIPGYYLTPRYGLTTSTIDPDGHKTTTVYAHPENALPTQSIQDPTGLNLKTTTGYEAPGAGYLRQTSKTLPNGQVSYAPTITADVPATWWRLGDASGTTAVNSAGSGSNGTYSGAYTLGVAGPISGDSTTAASFAGTTGQVTLPASLLQWTSTESVEAWFKTTSKGVIVGASTTAYPSGPGTAHDPLLYVGSEGKLRGELNQGSTSPITSTSSVADGKWHFAVLAASGTSQSLYLDSSLVGTLAGTISTANLTVPTIGNGYDTGWPMGTSSGADAFNGTIADVALYPSALSQAKISKHFQVGMTGAQSTTYAYYGTSDPPQSNVCGQTASVSQAGMEKSETDPTPASGNAIVHDYVYDAWGRQVGWWVPSYSVWACTYYDSRGRVTQTTNAAGVATNTDYSVPGQMTVHYTDSGGTARTTVEKLDLLGRTISFSDETGTATTTSYDQVGRITSITTAIPSIKTFSRSYAYNNLNQLTSMTETASSPSVTINYTYDSSGRLSTATLPNGVVTTTQYDPNYGLVSAVLNRKSGVDLSNLTSPTYTHTPGGRISSKVAPGDSQTYSYDMAGRLSVLTDGAATTNYAYDGDTNRCAATTACSGSYVYDAADRLLKSPIASSYTYDSWGDLTSATPTSGGATAETIGYDGNLRATTINDGTTTTSDTLTTSGAVLREVVKNNSSGTTASDTTFAFADSGFNPVAAWPTSTPTAAAAKAYIQDGTGNLVLTDSGGTPTYDIANAHGDIVGTTSSAGIFTASPVTDVWGSGETTLSPLDYLGSKERFATGGFLGLVRMGQRLYSPNIGRFLAVDPIPGGSSNDYDYVNQDPINRFDINGLAASGRGRGPNENYGETGMSIEQALAKYRARARDRSLSKRERNAAQQRVKQLEKVQNSRRRGAGGDNKAIAVGAGAAGLGAAAIVWWAAKPAAVLCGPLVVVCAFGF